MIRAAGETIGASTATRRACAKTGDGDNSEAHRATAEILLIMVIDFNQVSARLKVRRSQFEGRQKSYMKIGRLNLSQPRERGYPNIMRRFLSTALLFLATTAFAQIKAVTELAVPTSPVATGASALNTSLTVLPPALSLSAASLTPSLTPVATPIAVLTQTGAALSAPSKEGPDPSAVSRKTFDAAKTPATSPEVAGRESTTRVALEEANNPRYRIVEPVSHPLAKAAFESVDMAAVTIPFSIGALILRGAFSDPILLTGAMLALWGLAFYAMRSHLGDVRSTVVGGWQASHDQKYRTDYSTGLQRDIRGKKYGEDRYDERAPGAVGRTATLLLAGTAALGAAAFLLL